MPERLRGYRILLVEDEYYIGAELDSALTAAGAEVIGPVPFAETARSLVAKHVCDAAVLDIEPADEDGYTVADDLTERQIPFEFATGYGAASIPDRFRNVSRWEKPYDAEKVVGDLIRILRFARA
jgi:DNA-binding NtrC family response regulator